MNGEPQIQAEPQSADDHSSQKGSFAEKARKIGHFLTGFVLLSKGYSKFEHHHLGVALLCWTAAAAVLISVLFHRRLERHVHRLEVLINFLEAAVLGSVAYITFHDDKTKQAAVWLLGALVTFLLAITLLVRSKHQRLRSVH